MGRQLSILNEYPTRIAGPSLLHELVSASSERHAIEHLLPDGSIETWTYSDLHTRSNTLAQILVDWFQPAPARIVPVLVQQCPELYIAQLAAIKAGAAFCPISIDAPSDRIDFICQDVTARVLVTTRALAHKISYRPELKLILLDDVAWDRGARLRPQSIEPSQAAYVMYTSGSTGLPKGVVLSHSAATQSLLAHDKHVPAFSRFLQFASPTFDVSIFEIFFTFFRGATLICGEKRKLLTDLPGFINHMKVDAAELTPSVVCNLLDGRRSVPDLKILLTIGEMLRREVVEAFGGCEEEDALLQGMYGPTEAAIHCTLQTSVMKGMSVHNIGIPLDTVSVFIGNACPTSDDFSIMPLGEDGELTLGGHQLADHYLNRPEQTAEAFLEHPKYGRLYRTGDRARITDFGTVECLGRMVGGQVKLRGQRIELGEVEYAAARTPTCRAAVAEVIEGALVVFCVVTDRGLTGTVVQSVCERWLPSHMIPAEVLLEDDLPYLESGKVDRKQLKQLYTARQATKTETQSNTSPMLESIVRIGSNVLQSAITKHTNLSAAGMDSLTSIRLSVALRNAGLPQPNAVDLLTLGTAAEVEIHLKQIQGKPSDDEHDKAYDQLVSDLRSQVQRQHNLVDCYEDIEDVYPATPSQSGMLLETMKNSRAYCNWADFEVQMTCPPEHLQNCLHVIAQRHQLIRAGLVPVVGVSCDFAVIVWKTLKPLQIRRTTNFVDSFRIETERDLLSPNAFLVHQTGTGFRLRLQVHHALYDQWSLDLLRYELEVLLRRETLPSPVSFAEVVSKGYRERQKQERTNAEFWDGYLHDSTPTLLPTMSAHRHARALSRTPWCKLNLDRTILAGRCKAVGHTPASAFQASLAYLLSCFTASKDITYGMVFSGRDLALRHIDRIFGPCLHTLPCRIDISTMRTSADLLNAIRTTSRRLQSHAHVSLDTIMSHRVSEIPLFDVLFVWQETTIAPDDATVLEVDSADHHEYSLVIELNPSGGSIHGRATFRQDKIDLDQCRRVLDQLACVADSIVSEPAKPVEQLCESLPSQLLSISNLEYTPAATTQTLLGPLERFAKECPSATAILFANAIEGEHVESQQLTWYELNSQTDRLAQYLLTSGAQHGDVLCVCMHKSISLYVAIIAALKAGAGYLPLAPETPAARVEAILQQSGVTLCLVDASTETSFGAMPNVNALVVDRAHLPVCDGTKLSVVPFSDQLAYTVFTSGSTGKPKGVSVTVANLLGNLEVLNELYKVTPGHRLLQACSPAFDVSVFEIFFALYTGMCLCSATNDVLYQDLEASIRALKVTHLSLTPTVAALIRPERVPSVEFLVTAGEGVTDIVLHRWAGKGLHQGYGPSETTNICTIKMNMDLGDALQNVGLPLRNTSAFVVDPDTAFSVLPGGSIGELVFGGEQVFSGYIGRPDLNKTKIITHPKYGRLYRSGDIGCILADGTLLVRGRLDDQVKIRGNRVELGEVSSLLRQQDGVMDSTAVLNDDEITAFIVPENSRNSDETTEISMDDQEIAILYDTLASALPGYMMPSKITALSKLPRTHQGKLDKRSLKKFALKDDEQRLQSARVINGQLSGQQPLSEDEEQIASVLTKVLGLHPNQHISRNSPFASLGLHSLHAIAMAKELGDQKRVRITVSSILQNGSIARLDEHLKIRSRGERPHGSTPCSDLLPLDLVQHIRGSSSFQDSQIKAILPCTPLQEAMLMTESVAYHNKITFSVSGDTGGLVHCWRQAISRHDILRTVFVRTEHKAFAYVQVVLQRLHICPIKYLSDSGCPMEPVDMSHPFTVIVRPRSEVNTIELHMHHAIYDGLSLSILLGEVEEMYRSHPIADPTPVQPFLVEVQRQQSDRSLEYWASHVRNFKPKTLRFAESNAGAEPISFTEVLPISNSDITNLRKHHAVSELAIYQAALAKTLASCLGCSDVCFGNVMSGRTVDVHGVERIVAPCFNTVPVRVDLSYFGTNIELLQALHRHNSDVLDHQLTPLRQIQRLSLTPGVRLFDVLLLLQGPRKELDPAIWTIKTEAGTMDLPFMLELQPTVEHMKVNIHGKSVSEEQARLLYSGFVSALRSCLDVPHTNVGHLDGAVKDSLAIFRPPSDCQREGQSLLTAGDEMAASESKVIRQTLAEFAGVEENRIGPETSIYQLGLDSLNAAQLANRLRKQGINVDAADVIEHRTCQALAVAAKRRTKPADQYSSAHLEAFNKRLRPQVLQSVNIPATDVEALRPCTSVQAGMISQSIQTDGQLYVNHVTMLVPNHVSEQGLLQAWGKVRATHQALRLGFCPVQDPKTDYAMVVTRSNAAAPPITRSNTESSLVEVERKATRKIMASLSSHPWHVTLIGPSFQPDRQMMLSIHHALHDAAGMQTILSDLLMALGGQDVEPAGSIDNILIPTLVLSEIEDHSHVQFWKNTMREASVVAFPNLHPTKVDHRGLHALSTTISIDLETFCRSSNATVQALGQSAWALLLAEYTDSAVTFGTVITPVTATRTVFPNLVILPVVCCCNYETSAELLHYMVEYNGSAYRHSLAGLGNIQRYAGLPGEKLFDTMFTYRNLATGGADAGWNIIRETASVDYVLSQELLTKQHHQVELRLTFDTAHIPRPHAELILEQYDAILRNIVEGIAAQDDRLPIYSIRPPQQRTLSTCADSLHGLFECAVRSHPDRPALEFIRQIGQPGASRRQVWTYTELDARASQVAHLLHRSNVPPGSIVAVCMEKSPEASFAFIGVLKAGCAFLAIDPQLPIARLDFILTDSQARMLFTNSIDLSSLIKRNVPMVQLTETLLDTLPTSPPVNVAVDTPIDISYVLYTSGTTGEPKGCEISHENAVQAMMAFQKLFKGRWSPQSRWLQFASYWFDVSVLEQFYSWSVGITVVGATRDLVMEDISGFIQKYQISHLDLTPSLARLLRPEDVPSLCGGVFITGGEALKQEIIDAWGPYATVCNGYGPTEATIGVTMEKFIGSDAKPSNIGKAFENVGTYVLKPESETPVLTGGMGELCVAGKLVGNGYLNRPDLTARCFPHLQRFGERVYRTGDLVRMLADGTFLFCGRIDSQTKLRGQRLELAEIDSAVLRSSDEVNCSTSLVIKSRVGKEMLVTFITINNRGNTESLSLLLSKEAVELAASVRVALVSQLPDYMVPTHILPISYLPLTVNNKVDNKRLVAIFEGCSMEELQKLQSSSAQKRQLTPKEIQIRDVLCELLDISIAGVSAKCNLFSLGLSSISAIHFASSLKKEGFTNCTIAKILGNPTITRLAEVLSGRDHRSSNDQAIVQAKLAMSAFEQRYRGVASSALGTPIEELEVVIPCTPLQEGIIYESGLSDDGLYFNEFRFDVTHLNERRLTRGLETLIARVQMLRASFVAVQDGYLQAIVRERSLHLNTHICTESALESQQQKHMSAWKSRNISNIAQPFEAHLYRMQEKRILHLFLHHALYDGISLDYTLELLVDIYNGVRYLEPQLSFTATLPMGPLKEIDTAERFWREYFTASAAEMPNSGQTAHLPGEETLRLTIKCNVLLDGTRAELGVSHQAIVQTCFEVACSIHLPTSRLYGMVVSGRALDAEGADRVLGPMFNTLPQAISLSGQEPMSKHICKRQELSVQLLEYQHTPIRQIRKWCFPGTEGPIFDILFVFQHQHNTDATSWKQILRPLEIKRRAEFPMAFEAELQQDGVLKVTIVAKGSFIDRATLESFAITFREAMGSIFDPRNLSEIYSLSSSDSKHEQSNSNPVGMNVPSGFPWDERAEFVRKALASIAGVDCSSIDEHTTIFTLGVDSIDAVRLSSVLRKAGIVLPVSQVLKASTIPRMIEMAKENFGSHVQESTTSRLSMLQAQLGSSVMPSLADSNNIERLLPATPQQESLISDMLRSELNHYFNHDVLQLRPQVELDRLSPALQRVVDSTPILRTRFVEVDDASVDVVFAQAVLRKCEIDPKHVIKTEMASFDDLFDAVRRDVLDTFRTLPPMRFTFFETDSGRFMILSLAHALYDGHSLALLHEDIKRAYQDALEGRPSYDGVLEQVLSASSSESQRFWSGMLSGARSSPFPRRRPNDASTQPHRAEIELPTSTEAVRTFCQRHNVSVQALAQTCWSLTLAHYTQSLDVTFGVVLACRDSEEAGEIVFPTMNTVAVRASLHGTRLQFLQYMQGLMTDMAPYQRTPLRIVQQAARVQSQRSLFDTLFIYQKRPAPRKLLAMPLYDSVGGSANIEYPVAVEMEEVGDQFAVRTACLPAVMDEKGVHELLRTMEMVLAAILDESRQPTVTVQDGKASIVGLRDVRLQRLENLGANFDEIAEVGLVDEGADPIAVQNILGVLAQVAGVSETEVSANTSIESFGIDSISAIKVVGLLRKKDIQISVSELLKARTAAGMAIAVAKKSRYDGMSTVAAKDHIAEFVRQCSVANVLKAASIDPVNVEDILPTTAGQSYLLALWAKTGGQPFTATFGFRKKPGVSAEAVKIGWTKLVERHSILRTVFCSTMNKHVPLLQVVLRSGLNPGNAGTAMPPSALQPMARLEILDEAVKIRIHHALYDAVSLPLLIDDLNNLIAGTSTLEPKMGLADFIAPSLPKQAIEHRKTFWKQYLLNCAPSRLSQPITQGPENRVEIFMPNFFTDVGSLEALARQEDMSIQSIIFAAYAQIYARLAQRLAKNSGEDVILGIYLARRSHHPHLGSLAAPSLNMVPLLVRKALKNGLLDLARRVQDDLREIGTPENSAVSLAEIYGWTGQSVDTFVNYLRLPERDAATGNCILEEDAAERQRSRSGVIEATAGHGELPRELTGLKSTSDAYKHSVDMEVTVSQGDLSVGLFCPESMLGLEEATNAVQELRKALGGVMGQAGS